MYQEELEDYTYQINDSTYVLIITLGLICIYLMNNKKMLTGGKPIISLNGILGQIGYSLIIITLIMGIFTFPILFYAGLFFYVVQNYMFAFMKRI